METLLTSKNYQRILENLFEYECDEFYEFLSIELLKHINSNPHFLKKLEENLFKMTDIEIDKSPLEYKYVKIDRNSQFNDFDFLVDEIEVFWNMEMISCPTENPKSFDNQELVRFVFETIRVLKNYLEIKRKIDFLAYEKIPYNQLNNYGFPLQTVAPGKLNLKYDEINSMRNLNFSIEEFTMQFFSRVYTPIDEDFAKSTFTQKWFEYLRKCATVVDYGHGLGFNDFETLDFDLVDNPFYGFEIEQIEDYFPEKKELIKYINVFNELQQHIVCSKLDEAQKLLHLVPYSKFLLKPGTEMVDEDTDKTFFREHTVTFILLSRNMEIKKIDFINKQIEVCNEVLTADLDLARKQYLYLNIINFEDYLKDLTALKNRKGLYVNHCKDTNLNDKKISKDHTLQTIWKQDEKSLRLLERLFLKLKEPLPKIDFPLLTEFEDKLSWSKRQTSKKYLAGFTYAAIKKRYIPGNEPASFYRIMYINTFGIRCDNDNFTNLHNMDNDIKYTLPFEKILANLENELKIGK